jgi:CheY-like chemotaxis protein
MSEKITNNAKPRVLVADDEQVIANTLAIILNQAGFEARAVYSGEKAIDALDSFQPDMLISDVIMTGMTGIEAAIQTRAKLPRCKILLFSGQAATADLLERARTQGHEFEILRTCSPSSAASSTTPAQAKATGTDILWPSRFNRASRHVVSGSRGSSRRSGTRNS